MPTVTVRKEFPMTFEIVAGVIAIGFSVVLFWIMRMNEIANRNVQIELNQRLLALEEKDKLEQHKALADNIRLKRENGGLRRRLGEVNDDEDVFPARQQPVLKFNKRGGNNDIGEEQPRV